MEKLRKEALLNAQTMMAKAGFRVSEDIQVAVDERLLIMGYSTQRPAGYLIVVSRFAAGSGLLEGLLIHEMSHIYRMVTEHPSHSQALVSTVVSSFTKRYGLDKDYQTEVLYEVVNHIKDLYADDVTFKVFAENRERLPRPEQMSEFFPNWVKDEPVRSNEPEKDRWTNASIMMNNCFAISNMRRHSIEDVGERAKTRNKRFLSRISRDAAEEFSYFSGFMVKLKEENVEKEFQLTLEEYLGEILDLIHRL